MQTPMNRPEEPAAVVAAEPAYTLMSVSKEPSDVVSEAMSSWLKTLRLCIMLIAATPAITAVVFVLLLLRG